MTKARNNPFLNRVARRPVIGGFASAALLAACGPAATAPAPAASTAAPQANAPAPTAQATAAASHINQPAPGTTPKYGGTFRMNADDFWSSTQNIFTNWSSMYVYKFFFNQLCAGLLTIG